MNKLISSLVCSCFFLAATIAPATAADAPSSADIVKVAAEYLAAYSTFDPQEIVPHFTDDAVFSDPTSTTQNADGGPFVFEGKEAVLTGLGDYAAQYKDFTVAYDIERQYESNGVVVFIAQLTYTVITNDDQTFTGTAPIVTAIEVRDGKVARHTDFYDYAGNAANFRE